MNLETRERSDDPPPGWVGTNHPWRRVKESDGSWVSVSSFLCLPPELIASVVPALRVRWLQVYLSIDTAKQKREPPAGWWIEPNTRGWWFEPSARLSFC